MCTSTGSSWCDADGDAHDDQAFNLVIYDDGAVLAGSTALSGWYTRIATSTPTAVYRRGGTTAKRKRAGADDALETMPLYTSDHGRPHAPRG